MRATSAAATSAGPTSVSAAGVERCHTGGLAAGLVPGSPGAGQRAATLVLRNTGARTCTIEGYGGIGLYDPAGRALPTRQLRLGTPAPGL